MCDGIQPRRRDLWFQDSGLSNPRLSDSDDRRSEVRLEARDQSQARVSNVGRPGIGAEAEDIRDPQKALPG